MATSSQKSDFVSKTRQEATDILDAVNNLAALKRDYDYLDLGNTLLEADCQGLAVADVQAVFTTLAALETLLGQGHGTNLAKVRVG